MCAHRRLAIPVTLAAILLTAAAGTARAQDGPPGATGPAASLFAGLWDYNAAESINITTGRPEQSSRTASARPPAPPPRTAAQAGDRTDPAAAREVSPFGPTPEMIRENRDMSRDLLEVPETLRMAVDSGTVTFTDDLQRERTFPTDNSRGRYRLGAAEFFARVRWDGPRLHKDIEGPFGYRMSETYFLSPDARRLFVIVRVGEPNRRRPPTGFDRVYDRIEPAAP